VAQLPPGLYRVVATRHDGEEVFGRMVRM